MENIEAKLYPCAHCSNTGTCSTAFENRSCAACIKKHELKGKEYFGLACGFCQGLGQGEAITERLNKRVQPLLAMGIVFVAFIILFFALIFNSPHFSEVLAFIGTLIGGIVGFYFSSRQKL